MKFPLIGVDTRRLSLADYKRCAEANNLPIYNLQGVIHVEAGGRGYNARGLIMALYEYHIAWRRTKGNIRNRLIKAGLAVRRWGAKKYPKSIKARHSQIKRAYGIAGAKAFEFSSYGLPQMMGFNHKICGFTSAEAMVKFMLVSEANQLEVMIRFLKGTGLIEPLRKGDWPKLARGYNGKSYAKHGYDKRLAHASNMYKRNPDRDALRGKSSKPAAVSDEDVMKAQRWLIVLGYKPGAVDGWMGGNTAKAVLAFQNAHPALANDGKIGPQTLAALEKAIALKIKPQSTAEPAGAGVAGSVAVAVGALFGGWIIWAGVALVLAGAAYIGWQYFKRRDEFSQEITQQKNAIKGKVINVPSFEERGHPQDALPLSMRAV